MTRAAEALEQLREGNERFRTGSGVHRVYDPAALSELSRAQSPIAAILACSDSRVSPEIVFDQPLGSVFAARTPGNVHADSVKWMLDIAVGNLDVPLVLVVGHTGCLAVSQIVAGQLTGPGGPLRSQIQAAYLRVRGVSEGDVLRAAVTENVYETVSRLKNDSWELRRAMGGGKVAIKGAVYDMETGAVEFLPDR